MYHKSVFGLVVLVVLVPLVVGNPWQRFETRSQATHKPLELVTIIQLEEPCVRQGGICMPVGDCHPSNRMRYQADLCPAQRHLGVECCYVSIPNCLVGLVVRM